MCYDYRTVIMKKWNGKSTHSVSDMVIIVKKMTTVHWFWLKVSGFVSIVQRDIGKVYVIYDEQIAKIEWI